MIIIKTILIIYFLYYTATYTKVIWDEGYKFGPGVVGFLAILIITIPIIRLVLNLS